MYFSFGKRESNTVQSTAFTGVTRNDTDILGECCFKLIAVKHYEIVIVFSRCCALERRTSAHIFLLLLGFSLFATFYCLNWLPTSMVIELCQYHSPLNPSSSISYAHYNETFFLALRFPRDEQSAMTSAPSMAIEGVGTHSSKFDYFFSLFEHS